MGDSNWTTCCWYFQPSRCICGVGGANGFPSTGWKPGDSSSSPQLGLPPRCHFPGARQARPLLEILPLLPLLLAGPVLLLLATLLLLRPVTLLLLRPTARVPVTWSLILTRVPSLLPPAMLQQMHC